MTEKEISSVVNAVMDAMPAVSISLENANRLIDAVKAKAKEMGVKAVVAVSDAHTNPISVQCMEDSYIASYDIAVNKAFTVTSLKMSTSVLKALATPGGSLYGIQFTNQGKIVIFGGGEPLYDKKGRVSGGLGVSGGSEEQDTELAKYGAKWYSENLL